MKKIYAFSLFFSLTFVASAQTFTMNSSLIPGTHNSGGCTGVTDMNNDGLDDIVILDNSRDLSIAYQQAGAVCVQRGRVFRCKRKRSRGARA